MKKRHNDGQDQRAVRRGWALIQNYRKEDPVRHLDALAATEEGAQGFEAIPHFIQSEMVTVQGEVVEWLEFGITAWFGFYFDLGEGSAVHRRQAAGDGLNKTSERLSAIAGHMASIPARGTGWDATVRVYRDAVRMWAISLDLIARGARFDDKRAAADGFERLDRASATAEIVVDLRRGPQAFLDLPGALWTLERLEPKSRVRAKLVAEAKKPWERALKAAGSRLDWAPFPS